MPERVERVEVFGVAVPLAGRGFENAYVTNTVRKRAIVRITAASGAVGLGNIDPSPDCSTETIEESLATLRSKLTPPLIGIDAANIYALLARLDALTPGFLDAKAAIEMANGRLPLPGGPGLGVRFDDAKVESFRFN